MILELLFYIVILLFFILLGVPVAFGLALSSAIIMLINQGTIIGPGFAQMIFSGLNSFVLVAVPLFIFTGKLMNVSGITNKIFSFANELVGFFPGGLGNVNVVASIIFSGMSGTAISDVAGLGQIEMKAMVEEGGYDKEFSGAVTGASATVGPIIPPSIPLVVYGVTAGVSVGALFLAGILPGIIIGIALMIYISLYSYKAGYPRNTSFSFIGIINAFKKSFLSLLTPIIIIFGIYSGVFTPTEAAAAAALYALLLSMLYYKAYEFKDLLNVLRETVSDTATIGLIVGTASLYGHLIVRTGIPAELAVEITDFTTNPILILLICAVIFLFVGTFLETLAAITLLVPILRPILMIAGVDLVHFGIVLVLNLMIGVLSPPFGLSLYVLARVGKIDILKLVKALIPFYLILLFVLLLLILFPSLSTYLPYTLM